MSYIDFSCKRGILLEDEWGVRVPMDMPYFRADLIAPDTWRVLSDGDYSYLVIGDDEALAIDSGYGAGDIRAYCQMLTSKPVRRIANTHHHFDHTANNSHFDVALMSKETCELATIPFPSFSGIEFSRDYPVQILDDGDMIDLHGRELLVLKIPDHAVGSLAFLDKKERILFSGDEFMAMGKFLNGSVERWMRHLEKVMAHRGEFDVLWSGGGELDARFVENYLSCAKAILAGAEGEAAQHMPFPNVSRVDEQGRTVWRRRFPHPGDGPSHDPAEQPYLRRLEVAGVQTVWDVRKLYEDR